MQKYTIHKCPACGSNDFYIREKTVYKSLINKEGTLESYDMEDYRIEKIWCKECKSKYSVNDFIDIDLGVW